MNQTKIEWTDKTWNPAVGCSKRCHDEHGKIWCYAYWQAKRQKHRCQQCYEFIPHLHPERLGQLPLPFGRSLLSKKDKKTTEDFCLFDGRIF